MSASLAELQRATARALHHQDPDALAPHVTAGARAPQDGIETYRSMYWARLVEALGDDHPALLRRLGPAHFEGLVAAHLARAPSRTPTLAALGHGLDATLAALGIPAEAAIARLERAIAESFVAEDAAVVDGAALGALGDALGAARLRLHPSVRVVHVRSGARVAVLEGDDTSANAALALGTHEDVLVWRRALRVEVRAIDAREADALARAARGQTVAEVLEVYAALEDAEHAAVTTLVAWLERGLVAGVDPDSQTHAGGRADA